MTSCERCWVLAKERGVTYHEQLRAAEEREEPCTLGDLEAKRLQAGDYWDAERQVDSRLPHVARVVP